MLNFPSTQWLSSADYSFLWLVSFQSKECLCSSSSLSGAALRVWSKGSLYARMLSIKYCHVYAFYMFSIVGICCRTDSQCCASSLCREPPRPDQSKQQRWIRPPLALKEFAGGPVASTCLFCTQEILAFFISSHHVQFEDPIIIVFFSNMISSFLSAWFY